MRSALPQEPAAAQLEPGISGKMTTRYGAERQIILLGPVVLSAGGALTARLVQESAQDAQGRNEARLSHEGFRLLNADVFTFHAVWIDREETKIPQEISPSIE